MSTRVNTAFDAFLFGDVLDNGADKTNHVEFPASEPVTLDLADMIEDANGEVVLFNDSHLTAMAVRTGANPIEKGDSGQHVTASGADVAGFHFISFDNGVKLFYQDGLDLVVVPSN